MARTRGQPYKRILLKVSGEAIEGKDSPFHFDTLDRIVSEIVSVHSKGIEIGLIVGGGNILRGVEFSKHGYDRNQSDYMGMLATIINGLLLENIFLSKGVPVKLQSALRVDTVTEDIFLKNTHRYLEEGHIVILAGGTGNPYFTTDTAAALRACEIKADLLMKATKVDGVFDKDPVVHKNAVFYDTLTYKDFLRMNLKVMDSTAVAMCRDQRIPIAIFNIYKAGNIQKIVEGSRIGTTIKE